MSSRKTTDQTQFAAEKPLFEKPVVIEPAPEEVEQPQAENLPVGEEKKKISKLKLVLLIAGGFIVLIIILAVVVRLMQRNGNGPIKTEPADKEQQTQEFGPFQARLNEIQTELEAADPIDQDLPFPPVDLEITLEE